jgi:hypothetical protein
MRSGFPRHEHPACVVVPLSKTARRSKMMYFRTILSNSLTNNRIALALKTVVIAALFSVAITPLLSQQFAPYSSRYRAEAASASKKPAIVPGKLVIPASSQINPEDKGKRAHTNIRFILPVVSNPNEVPVVGYAFETPASLACIYQVVTPQAGCNPNTVTVEPLRSSTPFTTPARPGTWPISPTNSAFHFRRRSSK